ncbi:hypothetical protein AB0H83_50290 [Dactylosporangium sp. NPDC050688]|uniref:hypothetical protein n=1 Tax=Dactylosporangium sp. NPDC050688 TaxID=3157217 RepID=UPI0033EEDD93
MTTAIRGRRCLRATRTIATSILRILATQRLHALPGPPHDTFRTLFGCLLTSAGGCVYCGIPTSYLPVSVARVAFAVHSDVMSSSGAERYYWCLSHQRVESEADMCAGRDRLGPYDSASEAEQALTTVQKRNEAWDAEDERWEGKH